MSDEANELLAPKAPAVKYPNKGDSIKGTITDIKVSQQTDIDGNPKCYDDGNPMKQIVLIIETDDGPRSDYVKGQALHALRQAINAEGNNGKLEIGAEYARVYTEDKASDKPGRNAQKIFSVAYKSPTSNASADALLGDKPSAEDLL